MRKFAIASVLTLSAISLTPVAVLASPGNVEIIVSCPAVNGQKALGNFGDYIAGYGEEVINGNTNPIYFQSASLPEGMPSNLSNYRTDSVKYYGPTQKVTCNYLSGFPNEPAFAVSYTLTNGRGGVGHQLSNDRLSITLPVGFRA